MACGSNIRCVFLTYISNACHSLLGVAERLQHTVRMAPVCNAIHICMQQVGVVWRQWAVLKASIGQRTPLDRIACETQDQVVISGLLESWQSGLRLTESCVWSGSSHYYLVASPQIP